MKPDQPAGQDLAEFGQAFVRGHVVGGEGIGDLHGHQGIDVWGPYASTRGLGE